MLCDHTSAFSEQALIGIFCALECSCYACLVSMSGVQAQLSSQLGSLGPASLGSLPLSSLGSMVGQSASRMSSYGQQYSSGPDSARRMSLESLNHFSPGALSGSSLGSRNRGLTEQQVKPAALH